MKKLFFLFCAALLVLLAAPACRKNSVPSKKIGVSIPAADHGWAAGVVWNSEQAKAEIEAKYPGSQVIVLTAKNTKEQTDSIETLLMQQVDALVVMSQDPLPLTNVCKKALKQGVFLAIVSNPVPDVTPDLFVNGDNRSFGIAGAKAIGESLSGKGKIVIMKGQPCPIDNDRVGGFKETLQAQFPEITLIDEGDAFWNAQKGQQLMETFLQKHQQIDGVWAGDDDVLEGVLKAYEKSGRTDVQVFVGGGGAKSIVKKIVDNDPKVKATVSYTPAMIRDGIDAAVDFVFNGKKPEKPEISVLSKIIRNDNAKEYYFPDSPY